MQVIIEPDVWIGFAAVVLTGVTVGRGAIIGAGAVVRDDVPAYAVVVGNPAHQVSIRSPDCGVMEHESRLLQDWGL